MAELPRRTAHLDDHATWVTALHQVRADIAEKRKMEEAIEQQIKALIGDATEARVDGKPVITYRWTKPRERIDAKKLRDEQPDIARAYTVTGEATRQFRLLDPGTS